MYISKVNFKGGITIPAEIRHKHGIRPETKVTLIEKDGSILIQQLNKKYFSDLDSIWTEIKSLLNHYRFY